MTIVELLSKELNQKAESIENVIRLLDEGNTIPFIARYRKELHGAMDDTTLRTLETRLQYLRSLQERRSRLVRKPLWRMAAARASGVSNNGISSLPARRSFHSSRTGASSSRTMRMGFPRRTAVRISLKQLGDSMARSERK